MGFPVASKSKFRGCCPPQTLARCSMDLVVELLGPLIQGHSLSSSVHYAKSGDSELLAGLHDRCRPSAWLTVKALLRNDLAPLVQAKVDLRESSLGVLRCSVPNLAVRAGLHLSSDTLGLLHLGSANSSLRCFWRARFRGLRCFWCFGFLGDSDGLPRGLTGGATSCTFRCTRLGSFAGNGLGGHVGYIWEL